MISPGVGKYKKLLEEILKNEIYPLFLNNSFKQNGNCFYKIEQDIVKYIDLEYFRFNTYAAFFYWFNFHLFSGDFQAEKKINHNLLLTKGTGVFCERIGYLWSEKNHMYQLTSSNTLELTQKMKNDITQYLIPFFDKINNIDDAVNFLIDQNKQIGANYYSLQISIIFAKAGRREESKKYLLESEDSWEIKQKTAQFYGIDLD